MKTIAVILSGCGYLDGAEIRESVATLWALSQHDLKVKIFAPDEPQPVVMNHYSHKATGDTRNMLVEAARIARGKIAPLSELPDHDYDALIMPGGFGVAKNLCTFAADGASGSVIYKELHNEITAMHGDGRPIGAICIAPALIGLALKGKKLELTLGAEGGEAEEMRKLGHTHFVTRPNEIHIDSNNNLVTTPAYMYGDAPINEVFEGVKKLVDEVVRMM
ncbi:MAG: isoprenoid biosynthesis glyoxalase ElbB [Bacteroidota bacterium]|nr:isoprenoid biosynthesis glyoxalase ElbB [Bacteroidota bacterium]MDP4228781.1 isoprenoid biosynthesis glyoxalase ElbB [Bacteroidota bacterium]MDP4236893.1 isoprenoid biosynthesis glyoxalase ElbB [Bacteroidota bacterium]